MVRMSTNTPIVNPSYMAGYPSYSLTASLPQAMYYFTNNKADDRRIWATSFYEYAPFTDPAVTYNQQTGNYTLGNTDYGVEVKGQTNVVTLPSAVANPGKIYWVRFVPNNPAAVANTSWTYNMKVNTVSGQTLDGGTATSYTYSGTVAGANPAAVNGPTRIIGFYSNGTGWVTAPGVAWANAAVNTTAAARFATAFTPGKSELFPLPQPVRDANPNITQNPGY
jgi:hypothetical protein